MVPGAIVPPEVPPLPQDQAVKFLRFYHNKLTSVNASCTPDGCFMV